MLAKPRSSIERLRAAVASRAWQDQSGCKCLALPVAMLVSCPIATLIEAVREEAAQPLTREGSKLSAVATLYVNAIARNFPPSDYARYRNCSALSHADMADILLPVDQRGLNRLSKLRGALAVDVQNKARFEVVCRRHGLPCVESLASFDHGLSFGEERLRSWTEPFFVKALTGNRGAGAEQWTPSPGGFRSSGGAELRSDELIGHFRSQNCVVQPLLHDCEALRDLGSLALSSLRIITV